MDYEYVLTEKKGRIGYVILNRPKKLNALNKAFVGEIVDALKGMDDDREVRVIVIKGNGQGFHGRGRIWRQTSRTEPPM